MSLETEDQIKSRLLLRELGLSEEPLPFTASLTAIDVEDSFLPLKDDPEFRPTPSVNPNSEPE